MANFYAQYPPQGVAGSNASVGLTGQTAPTSATEVGGIGTGGNLEPINIDSSGRLEVTSSGGSSPVNANGSYAQITNLTTTAQTFTVPANAIGFILESDSSVSTVNIRWKIGAAATTSSGMVLEPGRDTGFIPCAANISVIAVSGSSQSIAVQWILSS
jgi:hypothetical protein